VLESWAHPWLRHESYVEYKFGRIERASTVENAITSGSFIERDPADDWLVAEIVESIHLSESAKPFLIHFLTEWE